MDAPRRFPFITAIAPRLWSPVIVAVLAFSAPAHARDDADNPNKPDDLTPAERAEPEAPEQPWKQEQITLPAFPRAADLLPLRAETGAADYSYYIDVNSVTLTADEVLRYTIIIQAPSGSSNIIYEGIRCATKEAKAFAYGTRDGYFRLMPDPEWTYVHSQGLMSYRSSLVELYVCDANGWAVDRDTVLERLVMHDPRRPRLYTKEAPSSD